MGFLGIVITVVVMAFGAGYFLLNSTSSGGTFENPPPAAPVAEQFSSGVEAIDAAKDASRQVIENSQRSAESVDQGTANRDQGAGSNEQGEEQGAKNNQQKTENQGNGISIKNRLVPFGYEAPKSPRTIDTIILHSSYNSTGGDEYSIDKVIGIWKSYGVAPHYMIDRKGNISRLVADKHIAYHAGVSKVSDGRTNVNDFSIGVEMLNSESDKYTDAQYAAVRGLIAELKGKYDIEYVLGHDDIAPGRKTDPWNFEWKKIR